MTDQGKAMGNEGPIEWTGPDGFKMGLRVFLVDADNHGARATEATLAAAGYVSKAELDSWQNAAFLLSDQLLSWRGSDEWGDACEAAWQAYRALRFPTPEPGEPAGGKTDLVALCRDLVARWESDGKDYSAAIWRIRDWLGGKPVPAETAGEPQCHHWQSYERCIKRYGHTGSHVFPSDWQGRACAAEAALERAEHRAEQLQSALTRAEGRVRELESDLIRVCYFGQLVRSLTTEERDEFTFLLRKADQLRQTKKLNLHRPASAQVEQKDSSPPVTTGPLDPAEAAASVAPARENTGLLRDGPSEAGPVEALRADIVASLKEAAYSNGIPALRNVAERLESRAAKGGSDGR